MVRNGTFATLMVASLAVGFSQVDSEVEIASFLWTEDGRQITEDQPGGQGGIWGYNSLEGGWNDPAYRLAKGQQGQEPGNTDGDTRNLEDEDGGYGDLARHLWDEETRETVDYHGREDSMEGTTDGFARYLWDEEQSGNGLPARAEFRVSRDLWEEEVKGNGLLARYLWDAEEVNKPAGALASYLWQEDHQQAPAAFPLEGDISARHLPYLHQDDVQVAHYLWDGEEEQGNGVRLAGYLWDPEQGSVSPTAPLADDISAQHLHYLSPGSEQQIAAYLWNENLTPAADPAPVMLDAVNNARESLYDQPDFQVAGIAPQTSDPFAQPEAIAAVASLGSLDGVLKETRDPYLVVAADAAGLDEWLQQAGIAIKSRAEFVNAVAVDLSARERAALPVHLIHSVVPDANVMTAGLRYSAKGDPELSVAGDEVAWTLHNIGRRHLTLDSIEISWPDANGELVSVSVDGAEVATSPTSGSALATQVSLDGKMLRREASATIALSFAGQAQDDQSAYDVTVHFEEGVSLSYSHLTSLPLQGRQRDTFYPTLIDADLLHAEGVTGSGVGVAVIDSGAWLGKSIREDTNGRNRVVAVYDSLENRTQFGVEDENGHGTHITSIIASSRKTVTVDGERTGSYHGVAPDANLVLVKAFDSEGQASYMDVIRAVGFVIAHKDQHNIRVLNLSFSGTPMSNYWQDPLNLAVMAAWRAGIVVVVASGNTGPDPMTIGVPGNVPYVVTVGAMTDHYTPDDLTDDYLASFSGSGPTLEGFVKPELTAPGGHMTGIMRRGTTIATEHPEFHDGYNYFLMSGTSQASAVAAGVAALILQENPDLTPDDVKCRLMNSANAAVQADGNLAYSIFQQGAGLVNAYDAVNSEAAGCVNQGLDIEADLAGTHHYGGPAVLDDDGNYTVQGDPSMLWSPAVAANDYGYEWNVDGLANAGHIWNVGYLWQEGEAPAEGEPQSWDLDAYAANGYQWDLAALEGKGYLVGPETSGYFWNAGDLESVGYFWNQNNLSQVGYFWNQSGVRSVGYFWNQNDVENVGYFWNQNDVENVGYFWNQNDVENVGYFWNQNDVENVGYFWNQNDVENVGYFWNQGNVEGVGYFWNQNDVENVGYFWNQGNVEGVGYFWNQGSVAAVGYFWNQGSLESVGYFWNQSTMVIEGSRNAVNTVAVNHWVGQE